MADSGIPLIEQVDTSQTQHEITVNRLFDSMSGAAAFGRNADGCALLTWAWYGVRYGGIPVANGSQLLTASSTYYMTADLVTGAVDIDTDDTKWLDTANYGRCYLITTGTTTVTGYEDHREGPGGIKGSGSGGGGTELSGLTFTSDTGSTADSDPGAGLMKWNNATQASATQLFFDNSTEDGVAIATFFAALGTDAVVLIEQADDETRWQLWEIDSATADSGYYDFAVTLFAKSTADIEDAKTVLCSFSKGASGVTFTGGTLTSAINEAPAVTIASSATPAIFAASANTISMTGTTAVTGFDTIAAGAVRRVVFAGAVPLTYHATTHDTITGASFTAAVGDVAEYLSRGSGSTKMISYTRADGTALVRLPPTSSPAFSATPTISTTDSEIIYFGALTANVTAFNLSGTRPKVIVCFVQDGTGLHTVTAGTSIDFGTATGLTDLSGIASAASAYSYVGFVYNPTTTKYRLVAIST